MADLQKLGRVGSVTRRDTERALASVWCAPMTRTRPLRSALVPCLGPLVGATLLSACAGDGSAPLGQRGLGQVTDSAVFINEIHYDNVGTDAGESIEVAGPAGTNLSGYSLVLYNGANGAVYQTTALSGVIPDQQAGYGAISFSYPENGLQNGSPDGVALVDDLGQVLFFLSYEGSFVAVGGPASGLTSTDIGVVEGADTPLGFSLALSGSGTAYEDFTWSTPAATTTSAPNGAQTFGGSGGTGGSTGSGGAGSGGGGGSPAEACGDSATTIASVQGAGFASPLAGQTVSIEGIVVGDFQGTGVELGGFFVQSETPDGDPLTSEGVFVFDQNLTQAVALGDRVRVRGNVTEYFGLTELSADQTLLCGTAPLPLAATLSLPFADALDLESLEGMLVQAAGLTVTETFNLGRYGEALLSSGGRLFQPNSDVPTAIPNANRRIVLDDGRDGQNLVPVPYIGEAGTLRLGDTLNSFTGILHYGFDEYRLQPLERALVTFARTNPRTLAPDAVGGDLRVASLNVLNYFIMLNARGANTALELERQRAKLVNAVIGLDADVLGLMEIENSELALDDFVAQVNAALGSAVYAKAPAPSFTGTDAIRTAIIYKPARVSANGPGLSDPSAVFSRPPIAQEFSAQGNVFTVVVNHFKSKGSCPASASDPNAEFGQGCWNVLRTEQATALLGYIEELTTASGDSNVIVLGDLNSYLGEDPIAVLEAGGLVNQDRTIAAASRYSYVFNGESGTLDYALTSPGLTVSGATIWHINADEPHHLDYNTEFNPPSAYEPHAYRASDHDPVVIGITWPVAPPVPEETLSELIDAVDAAGLKPLDELRLLAHLKLALAALEFGGDQQLPRLIELAQLRIARNQLGRFIDVARELKAKGKLSAALAVEWIAEAEALRELLSA